jgi:tyrosinase
MGIKHFYQLSLYTFQTFDITTMRNLATLSRSVLVLLSMSAQGSAHISAKINSAASQCPTAAPLRKEIRDLTDHERNHFFHAFEQLKTRPSKMHPKLNRFDDFSKIHFEFQGEAHTPDNFILWHRYFLDAFEVELRNVSGNPKLTIPFWDYTHDVATPQESIFGTSWWGKQQVANAVCKSLRQNGQKKVSGNQPSPPMVNYPFTHCLLRADVPNTKGWLKPEAFTDLMQQSQNYSALSSRLIYSHAFVHVGVGGQGGDMNTMFSPNDIVFWMLHSFVDKAARWWEQQNEQKVSTYLHQMSAQKTHYAAFGGVTPSDIARTGSCANYAPATSIATPQTNVQKTKKQQKNVSKQAMQIEKPTPELCNLTLIRQPLDLPPLPVNWQKMTRINNSTLTKQMKEMEHVLKVSKRKEACGVMTEESVGEAPVLTVTQRHSRPKMNVYSRQGGRKAAAMFNSKSAFHRFEDQTLLRHLEQRGCFLFSHIVKGNGQQKPHLQKVYRCPV